MDRRFVWLILIGVAVNRLTTLFPGSWYWGDPFLLYDMGKPMQVQAWVYFLTDHFQILIWWFAFWQLKNKFSGLFYNFMAIEVFSLFDYILIYEHPIFHLGNYGVEFTDIKILLYTYFIIRWIRQQ